MPIAEPVTVEIVLPRRDSDYVSNEMYELSEILGRRNPDAQAHGVLGGEWGYGQDFKNDVFEMHPFYWGDCECGFDEKSEAWHDAHPHTAECFHTRYWAEEERIEKSGIPYDIKHQKLTAWAKVNGLPTAPDGEAVHCDCGQDKLCKEWFSQNDHEPSCRVVMPNFRCGDVEVRWYKYIGRNMEVNRTVSRKEWRDIFARCRQSLGVE